MSISACVILFFISKGMIVINNYPNIGTPFFYIVFFVLIAIMIGIDIICLKKQGAHKVSIKEALIWSGIWVAVSCIFAVCLYAYLASHADYGPAIAQAKLIEFFTGYIVEKSLAMDNVFVFLMIFSYFKVPPMYQHRVLLYGVLGAIILRAIMIGIGAMLVQRFEWILYIFGAFLIWTGVHMMKPIHEEKDFSQSTVLKWLKRIIPVSESFDKERFFTIQNGKWIATPLFLVLIMVELSDVIFALDSIPAIFAITTDPFIVLTSNIFAILGLRAMYFLLADMADRFMYLKYGLAFVLCFIGFKMLIMYWIHIPVIISLAVIFGALTTSIMTSLLSKKRR